MDLFCINLAPQCGAVFKKSVMKEGSYERIIFWRTVLFSHPASLCLDLGFNYETTDGMDARSRSEERRQSCSGKFFISFQVINGCYGYSLLWP